MKNYLIILGLLASYGNSVAQTAVSGGIYSNTTWFKTASPYIVTGDIAVFPGKVLTIEPGVEVRFTGNYYVEIRGGLVAKGTLNDSITFCADTGAAMSTWNNIVVKNSTQNAYSFFEYCKVMHSAGGIYMECCMGNSSSYVENSLFMHNDVALDGYSDWDLPVKNCVFLYNNTGGQDGDKDFINCVFRYNDIAINCERYTALNCVIEYNNKGISHEGPYSTGTIQACSIQNNTVGIELKAGVILNNTITSNGTGIRTAHMSWNLYGDQYYVNIKNNQVCNNSLYNIENFGPYNMSITGNCFCETDSATVESLLFDGYDDITVGLFNYSMYDSLCNTVVQSYYKIGTAPVTTGLAALSSKNKVSVFPSPFSDRLNLRVSGVQRAEVYLYSGSGALIMKEDLPQENFISTHHLPSGIYFIEVREEGAPLHRQKLIKN